MKISVFTLLSLVGIFFTTAACIREDYTEPTEAFELEKAPLTKDIFASLNEVERAQFTAVELKELEQLLDENAFAIEVRSGTVVELPAGSQDALAAAIEAAGEGGTVLVKSGEHSESQSVTITHQVNIIGEAGASIQTNTLPIGTVGVVQPALHILNAPGVIVKGIAFNSKDPFGGTAVLVAHSPRTQIIKNSFTNHEIGVLVDYSDRVVVSGNTIATSLGWANFPGYPGYGVAIVNGRNARVIGNDITSSIFGVWACDGAGWYLGNTTHGNYIGLILCKVPQEIPLPNGEVTGSAFSANNWLTLFNKSFENLDAGYLVIDGANKNFLSSNYARDNGTYDIELVGDSERFGFFTPTSSSNRVYAWPNLLIKDCGENNKVSGSTLVDNTEDPCF